MAWSPLGTYFREENEQNQRIAGILKDLGPKYEADESQLLLAWVMKHPAIVHPVVGTTDPERLKRSLLASEMDIELEDWFLMHTASLGQKVP